VKTIENLLLTHGKPSKVHIASVIAAPEGIDYIKNNPTKEYDVVVKIAMIKK
jgi:uracil phosphoribosyltransferase